MKRIELLCTAAVLTAASACSPADPVHHASMSTEPAGGEAIPVVRLRGERFPLTYQSGLQEEARLVVRDAAAWREAWQRIWAHQLPVPERPEVDFTREMLIVAAQGERPSGGFGVLVDSAHRHADHIEVVIRTESPGRGCLTTRAITQPVDVARLPGSALPVRFRERNVVTDCP